MSPLKYVQYELKTVELIIIALFLNEDENQVQKKRKYVVRYIIEY